MRRALLTCAALIAALGMYAGMLTAQHTEPESPATTQPGTQGADQTQASTSDQADQPPASAGPRVPQLIVKNDKKKETLKLGQLDINAQIMGHLSRTQMIMRFDNSTDRVLEGELIFPLPEGAVVSAYGLDIKGELIRASTVEKHKARIAIETEIRKSIDPGLVEWVKGNNYRTRVYPIPAKGSRTVMVEYTMPLVDGVYPLKLNFEDKLDLFKFDLKADSSATLTGAEDFKTEKLKMAEDGFATLTFAREDAVINIDLKVQQPKIMSGHQVWIENYQPKGQWKPETYFLANVVSGIPEIKTLENPPSDVIGVAWDVSLSRQFEDLTQEYALLKQHINQSHTKHVFVTTFANRVIGSKVFEIDENSPDEIIAWLKSQKYDGGTQLGSLNLSGVAFGNAEHDGQINANQADYWVLFSDGLSNLGKSDSITAMKPVYTVSASSSANYPLLRRIARETGGEFLNLNQLALENAVNKIGWDSGIQLMSIDYDSKLITELQHKEQQVAGHIKLTGKLHADKAMLTLNYGVNGEVIHTEIVHLQNSESQMSYGHGMIAQAWAGMRLQELMMDELTNDQAIMELGKAFEMVTPRTSLLVLETLAQHLQHDVVPHPSRKEMYTAYMDQIEQNKKVQAQTREAKLKQIQAMWARHLAWWNKDFKYPKDFKWRAKSSKTATTRPATLTSGEVVPSEEGEDSTVDPEAVVTLTDREITVEGAERSMAEVPAQRVINRNRPADIGRDGDSSGQEHSQEGQPGATVFKGKITLAKPKLRGETQEALSKAEDKIKAYYVLRENLIKDPAFYLAATEVLIESGKLAEAERALTNLLELHVEDVPMQRIVARRLQQMGQLDLAISQFEVIKGLRPEEPQSYRDLALAYVARADHTVSQLSNPGQTYVNAFSDAQRALELMNEVIIGQWHGRFPEIELIVLMEANRLVANVHRWMKKAEPSDYADFKNPIPARFGFATPVELRIAMSWDTDATDIDLWVTEPSGEKCKYSHNRTTIGGYMSRDYTGGYGPEIYWVKKAMPGEYKIQANYYGSSQQTLAGGTTITVTLITNFGQPDEQRKVTTVRVTNKREVVDLGTFVVEDAAN